MVSKINAEIKYLLKFKHENKTKGKHDKNYLFKTIIYGLFYNLHNLYNRL